MGMPNAPSAGVALLLPAWGPNGELAKGANGDAAGVCWPKGEALLELFCGPNGELTKGGIPDPALLAAAAADKLEGLLANAENPPPLPLAPVPKALVPLFA